MIWIPLADPAATALTLSTKHLLEVQDECVLLAQVFNGRKRWDDLTPLQTDLHDMWENYQPAFATFGLYISAELKSRGAKQYMQVWQSYWERTRKAQKLWKRLTQYPHWWGVPELHESHRLRLCQLDKTHYLSKFELSQKDRKKVDSKKEVKLVWPTN